MNPLRQRSIAGHRRWGIAWWSEAGGGSYFRYTAYCLRLGPLTLRWAGRDIEEMGMADPRVTRDSGITIPAHEWLALTERIAELEGALRRVHTGIEVLHRRGSHTWNDVLGIAAESRVALKW